MSAARAKKAAEVKTIRIRQIRSGISELMNRLVDRHRLSPCGNSLAGNQLSVLPCYKNFSSKSLFCKRLDRASGGSIVRCHNRIKV